MINISARVGAEAALSQGEIMLHSVHVSLVASSFIQMDMFRQRTHYGACTPT